ncbi:MAG: phenylalanine--tRNA ligase subunit alpha [Candidatus Diapherotrites archaeon]|uniref:phenylalanine--tRNA ligase n=2 Tax=Candidatus Iainarchaeum sp. TaxID=3101447 RepID=A0A8T4KW87_9ARCH|nr:phenylalanine--tRNA ligase subunit alpha [Candidatus Diapherotrites archaeon]
MAEASEIASKLADIEKKALQALSMEETLSTQALAEKSGLNLDAVRRAMSWLNDKRLAVMLEQPVEKITLSEPGKKALAEGLPEKQLLMLLEGEGGKGELKALEQELQLGKEFNFALGACKGKNWITIVKGEKGIEVSLTGLEKDSLKQGLLEEKILQKIFASQKLGKEELEKIPELQKRGLIEKKLLVERSIKISALGMQALHSLKGLKEETNLLSSQILKTGSWKSKQFKKYNIQDPVPELFAGKRQPYLAFLQQIRRKLTESGFQEMESPLLTQEFYNFDVLFQPQNHPARQWSDTYQLKQPKHGKLPEARVVKKVKEAHEFGGGTGSKGWRYEWNEEIAKKIMPASHCTAHSARQLLKGITVPGKYFSISRVYRPDVIDAKHLVEFNQMEGFIVDESFTFKHLLGMLKQFAIEIGGCEKVKFYPVYFPFTEPSVQISAFHKEMGWMELCGAGIFRPEMMEALGYPNLPALAWGFGIDRLAMLKLGVKDIRYLFSDDLKYLRNAAIVGE